MKTMEKTLDEARLMEERLMANVSARAGRLFEDGYRARWRDRNVLVVRSPHGDAYPVDTMGGTCGCPFFAAHGGRLPCKHLLGWEMLLARQRERRLLVAYALLRAWAALDDGDGCRVSEGEDAPRG